MSQDWNWIKQRPQYIAEELAIENEIIVICPSIWWDGKSMKYNSPKNNIKLVKLPCIPKYRTNKIIKWIVTKLHIAIFKHIVKSFDPDYVWIPHPDLYCFALHSQKTKIIYDCMDNYVQLEVAPDRKIAVESQENALTAISDICFTSSENLKRRLNYKYGVAEDNLLVIRNGVKLALCNDNISVEKIRNKSENLTICYFGTISEWFDWTMLEKSLADFENIEYHIIGPISGTVHIPQNDRIIIHGPISHDDLAMSVRRYDVFFMPFSINELIEAVDPVKLYEYIYYNKNIICVYYDEISRFDTFVHFYRNYEEYRNIIIKLIDNNTTKYTNSEREEFLENNTWRNRVLCIQQVLHQK
jgi:hypothetical protein